MNEEIEKELDGFRLNVVLGLDVDYDVYKKDDIIRAVNNALKQSQDKIDELEGDVKRLREWHEPEYDFLKSENDKLKSKIDKLEKKNNKELNKNANN